MTDRVERPAAAWWISIVLGIGSLAVVGYSDTAYTWWEQHITGALRQGFFAIAFNATVAVHIAEAAYAFRLARQNNLLHSAAGWAAQTFLLGFPSLKLLRAKVAG